MKKILLLLIIGLSVYGSYSQNSVPGSISTINMGDTIVFDISQSVVQGNTVEFPVYFRSDDVINALDFSFRYNMNNFVYDSIIDLTNYISELSYFNPNDSFVRFTSYSFQNYTNDTALVSIRFTILSGQFCASDIDTTNSYLNGDPCTLIIINCGPSGINELNENETILVTPNPFNSMVTLSGTKEDGNYFVYDLTGKEILRANASDGETLVYTEMLSRGIYLIKYKDASKTMAVKAVKY